MEKSNLITMASTSIYDSEGTPIVVTKKKQQKWVQAVLLYLTVSLTVVTSSRISCISTLILLGKYQLQQNPSVLKRTNPSPSLSWNKSALHLCFIKK